MSTAEPLKTPRTTIRRLPKRAAYDRAVVEGILDEGRVCHIGFVADGVPFVLPTIYARVGDVIYLHGSAASRMLESLATGAEVCLTVTLVDGLVLARSAFHHSMNYRSVVVLGRPRLVDDLGERSRALRAIVDHVLPGRWDEVREPNAQELKATHVVALSISEASAKVRTGDPIDDEDDYALSVWAGQVPLRVVAEAPVPDARLPEGIALSPSILADARLSPR